MYSPRQLRLVHCNNIRTLYHATNHVAANSILRSRRMRPGVQGQCGAAIYFAETPEAARRKSQQGSERVLQVQVNLGNVLEITELESFTAQQLHAQSFDSVKLCDNDPTYAVFVPPNVAFSDQVLWVEDFASYEDDEDEEDEQEDDDNNTSSAAVAAGGGAASHAPRSYLSNNNRSFGNNNRNNNNNYNEVRCDRCGQWQPPFNFSNTQLNREVPYCAPCVEKLVAQKEQNDRRQQRRRVFW